MADGAVEYGAEAILLAGAGRAILLQLAHPSVGRGVAENSTFAAHPLDRLNSTLTYVYAITYGSEEQANEVRRRVNRAHAPVRRAANQTSNGYSAFDPNLQLWVAATLYDTASTVIGKIYGPLDDDAADAIYQHYARLGTALQLPPDMWPKDRAAFRRYWEEQLGCLRAGEAALQVARDLLHPANVPWWYRGIMPAARFLTAGLLPGQLRQDFGLDWSGRQERRFHRTMRILALTYPRLPQRLRHSYKNYCLNKLGRDLDRNRQPSQRQGISA
ncbi:oxygenase MpaB family protein [Pseudarthrobacter sp. alpha12b]